MVIDKIDVAKATGISMGLGNTSLEDMALMGAMLGAEGAFDDSPNSDILADESEVNSSLDGRLNSSVEECSSSFGFGSFEDTMIGINIKIKIGIT